MSGIVACFHRDRRHLDPQDLSRMVEAIAHRGPDGAQMWSDGSIGLGQAMLWTTPESIQERLPYTDPQLGCGITADARIDNREELIEGLGWSDRPPHEIPDSQLILASYLRWGQDCTERLLGDFAFAIWDPRAPGIFAVRDHIGVKPLYYHCSEHLLALGSEIAALLTLTSIPKTLNETRLAGYWVQRRGILMSIYDEYSPTLYQEINCLPPGHTLWVTPDHHRRSRYWQLDWQREIRLESNEAYAEAFREIFTKAVRCRLRSAYPIGTVVSGGLDSSSIACVARDLLQTSTGDPLHLYSAIFPNLPPQERRLLDERPYLDQLSAQPGFISHRYEADRLSPLRDQGEIYYHPDEWTDGNNLYLLWHAYRLAQEQGVRVLLDGVDGDIAVSHGMEHLQDLAQEKRWLELIQHRRIAHLYHGSPWRMVWDYLWAYEIRPTYIRGPLRQIWQRLQPTEFPVVLNPDFAERTQIQQRLKQLAAERSQYTGVRGKHYLNLSSGMVQSVLTSQDRVAARIGLEPRHPFFDRRLLEFCLALPLEQKLEQGWSRIVLRRAMQGILPPAIQWRTDKADVSPCFNRNLISFEHSYLKELLNEQVRQLQPYLDPATLYATYQRCFKAMEKQNFTTKTIGMDSTVLWSAALFARWLSHR